MIQPMPEIVCLCGSTKFKDAFQEANMNLTLAGKIVLSVGAYMHAENVGITQEQKVALDLLHLSKIDLADKVLVLNVGGYIGESTEREIAYAISQDRELEFVEPLKGEAFLEANRHRIARLMLEFLKQNGLAV